MGRKNQHTRDEIRDLAIDAAEARIQTQGMQSIQARAIAHDIGYAVGTLYQLFKNMDLLILAANLRTLHDLERHVLHASAQAPQGNHRIRSMAMAYVDYALKHTQRWQAVFAHQLKDEQDMPQAYPQQRAHMFQLLAQQFTLAYPDKSTTQIAIESRALWAGIHGICVLSLDGKLDDEGIAMPDIAQTLIQHFLNTNPNTQGEAP